MTLVSDDPSTWVIPPGLARAMNEQDSTKTALLDWWGKMRHTEEQLAPYGGVDSNLIELRERFLGMWHAYDGDVSRSIIGQRIVREAIGMGLTVTQAARLFGVSTPKLMSLALRTVAEDDPLMDGRIMADALLRDPTLAQAEIARRTGLTVDQVRTWANVIGVQPQYGHGGSYTNPKAIRELALGMYDEGMRVPDIVRHIKENLPEGQNLTASALYQWLHRTGRTKRRGQA